MLKMVFSFNVVQSGIAALQLSLAPAHGRSSDSRQTDTRAKVVLEVG